MQKLSAKATIACEILRLSDAGKDYSMFLTDDVELLFPKWGVVRGKAELGNLFADLGQYLKVVKHDTLSFEFIEQGDRICIEGVSSGELQNGRQWSPDGDRAGRFCTVFHFRGDLVARMRIYLDPDYVDSTLDRYPWHPAAPKGVRV